VFEGLFQPTHLIIVLVIVLIVFGPGKLPQIGGAIGQSLREFKRSASEITDPEHKPMAVAPIAMVSCPTCHKTVIAPSKFCGECGASMS
jgi:sec-independent protein translocase protein TatA